MRLFAPWRHGVPIAIAALLIAGAVALLPAQSQPTRTHLVIVVDGLRPDYVTSDVMPRLSRLGQRGVVFNAHHAVYPTVTRVNASSFVTGAYPRTHGLMGNTIYVPKVSETKTLDTGQRENLEAVARAEGALLTAPTLSEILTKAGKRLLAVSSGSTGSAFLLNHTIGSGAIVHPEFTRPAELAPRVRAALGAPPAKAMPNDPQNQYAVDAYLKFGLQELAPAVTFMWLNDPDGTAHAEGMGTPLTRKALTLVDASLGRLEDALGARGLLDNTNIIVTSDHGFSTHAGGFELQRFIAPFAKTLADGSSDIVVAEGAVYLRDNRDPSRISAIVAALQQRPEVGAMFTRAPAPGSARGAVAGTLSFDAIQWNHRRSGDILVSPNWSDAANTAGVAGTTTARGVAGHGASSPYDIHNTLIAAGPDFQVGLTSSVPTANVDIAPTILKLMGLAMPASMTGRVIREGLRNGPSPSSVRVDRVEETVKSADGGYQLTARFSVVEGHRYFDSTQVTRESRSR